MEAVLDACEKDFFGELAGDTHGLWEVFEFVRLHHPILPENGVFERGCCYIQRWSQNGWIRISDAPLYPSDVVSLTDLAGFLQQHGPSAVYHIEGSPSLDNTESTPRADGASF